MNKNHKTTNLLMKVKFCIQHGLYLDTRHASDRQSSERQINRFEYFVDYYSN